MLTDTAIRTAKPTAKSYKLYDHDRLFLLVHRNGAKYWRVRYRRDGKETVLSLGTYPAISLREAREKASHIHTELVKGLDPATERRKKAEADAGLPTFKVVAEKWLAVKKAKLSPSYVGKMEITIHANLYPRLGDKPLVEITATLVLECLRAMEMRGAVALARRCKTYCAAIFNYAAALDLVAVGYNPAKGLTGDVLGHHTVKHYPHLTEQELSEFLCALAEYRGRPETALAVRLLLLTFVRPGELRAARWSEFDFDESLWRIPAEKMKMRRPHVVPLSVQAIAALKELQVYTRYSPYLFPGGRGRIPYMSENTVNKAIALLGYKGRIVGHGFRATASTILNESREFHPDVIERQLAHKDRDEIRAIYDRAEHLEQRTRLMQWWADKLDTLTTRNVVALRKKA